MKYQNAGVDGDAKAAGREDLNVRFVKGGSIFFSQCSDRRMNVGMAGDCVSVITHFHWTELKKANEWSVLFWA